jgi:hypothetical protein
MKSRAINGRCWKKIIKQQTNNNKKKQWRAIKRWKNVSQNNL